MATNREQQVGHMTGFPPAVYPFAFNSMRSHSPFDLLANSSLFGRFGADLPKEMAALCKWAFVGTCKMKSTKWRESRDGPSEGVEGHAGRAEENKTRRFVFFAT
ncbi:Retinoic acid receptor gamma [Liparis tanakae]|uniref:Retinoic acid receptor gamma n=1 Tax=Liparis tanakae TaxID=230148 RepID=A0A4Z2IYA5_9TELE|nr:Retinoic acid receptor gamma [Liparis tanakae]